MSSTFEKEAGGILENAPKPDADASVIKEVSEDDAPKKKRGRPKGSGSTTTTRRGRPKKKSKSDIEQIEAGARGINSAVFASACVLSGTGDAWPDETREKAMDQALARYFIDKDITPPAEVALLAVYSEYLQSTVNKPTVKEGLKIRFGGWKAKIRFPRIFKKKNATQKPEGERRPILSLKGK